MLIAFVVTPWASHPDSPLGQKVFPPHEGTQSAAEAAQVHLHPSIRKSFTKLYRA